MVHSGCVVFKIHVSHGKNKTLAKILGVVNTGQILGVATPATPLALTPMSKYFAPIAGGGKVA